MVPTGQNMGRRQGGATVERFLETRVWNEVYIQLVRDWTRPGRSGLLAEHHDLPPVFVIGTIEEAQ
jgi:hypothetical protein